MFDAGVGRIEVLKAEGQDISKDSCDLSLEVENVWELWEHFKSSDFIV
jgi:hypothetical protein